jgi:ribosomal protein L7/L12/DNA-directed RNA polymerase subunit RPC12/RpoP
MNYVNEEDGNMAIVPLKCPKCGASVQLDDQQETNICKYCGSQFPFREAVQKYMGELAGKLMPDEDTPRSPVMFTTTTTTTVNGKTTTINGQDADFDDVVSKIFGAQSGFQGFSSEPIPGYDLPDKAVLAIRLLVANGQKIQAIKVFRQYTNVDLKEAKDVIDRLESLSPVASTGPQNRSSVIIQTTGTDEMDSTTIPGYVLDPNTVSNILSCLAGNQKIAAIKVFRDATNEGLKESKDAIDDLYARQMPSNFSMNNSVQKRRDKDPNVKVSRCYIATAVYGSYDAPQVVVLRRFRDEVLSKSLFGRAFIRTYYAMSPPVARRLENAGRMNRIVRRILDTVVRRLS